MRNKTNERKTTQELFNNGGHTMTYIVNHKSAVQANTRFVNKFNVNITNPRHVLKSSSFGVNNFCKHLTYLLLISKICKREQLS